jgi:hypothetical protein
MPYIYIYPYILPDHMPETLSKPFARVGITRSKVIFMSNSAWSSAAECCVWLASDGDASGFTSRFINSSPKKAGCTACRTARNSRHVLGTPDRGALHWTAQYPSRFAGARGTVPGKDRQDSEVLGGSRRFSDPTQEMTQFVTFCHNLGLNSTQFSWIRCSGAALRCFSQHKWTVEPAGLPLRDFASQDIQKSSEIPWARDAKGWYVETNASRTRGTAAPYFSWKVLRVKVWCFDPHRTQKCRSTMFN